MIKKQGRQFGNATIKKGIRWFNRDAGGGGDEVGNFLLISAGGDFLLISAGGDKLLIEAVV